MKLLILSLVVFGTFSSFASSDRVEIQIKASTLELCKKAAEGISETARKLEEKDLDIIEISNCNKSTSGKYVKKVIFQNVIDYNH